MSDYGYKEYFRIKLSKIEFANDRFHINVIVYFFTLLTYLQLLQKKGGGGYTKHRLSKFLYLHSVRKAKIEIIFIIVF